MQSRHSSSPHAKMSLPKLLARPHMHAGTSRSLHRLVLRLFLGDTPRSRQLQQRNRTPLSLGGGRLVRLVPGLCQLVGLSLLLPGSYKWLMRGGHTCRRGDFKIRCAGLYGITAEKATPQYRQGCNWLLPLAPGATFYSKLNAIQS
jgi:hypothetical protein